MQITLNDKTMMLTEGITLGQLLQDLEQDKPGVAVALNQSVVARGQWSEQVLNENDKVTLFHAIAGG
ncbi:sulfur carrier protein ThiS [Oceanisphaera avium]|uniref:Thiamine biosynthesis protein ThiS n=1 Tax=Oceanisphaera avium TaxID=1903694 RepID=A0A1Y0CZ10_9GAMM|nr:sulfur carrier protein ThiS [Oceanisphaera avium]ART80539.1 thiamine biosynthesis protein ThiS [Oceanisphaera avium]